MEKNWKLETYSISVVEKRFLENYRTKNYIEILGNMIKAFRCVSNRMNLKLHFLHSHLAFFPENLGAVNDEHRWRFYQDIEFVKKHCKEKNNANILINHCCFLQKQSKTKYHCSAKRVGLTSKVQSVNDSGKYKRI